MQYFTKYRLIQQSSPRSDLVNKGQKNWDIMLNCVAKGDPCKYVVVNEYIACELGRLIGVPVVDGFVVTGLKDQDRKDATESFYWASMSVGEALPDGDPQEVVEFDLVNALGSVAFDAWICNGDRSVHNFTFNSDTNQLLLFDHGESICRRSGVNHLEMNKWSLGLRGANVIARQLRSLDGIAEWVGKIQSISEWTIEQIVMASVQFGLTQIEAEQVTDQLVRRQRNLMYLFFQSDRDFDFPETTKGQLSIWDIPKVAQGRTIRTQFSYEEHDEDINFSI